MGGVVTNTFEMESLCKDLNLTSKDFYKICKYKNFNIWEDYQLGNICTNDFWATFNKIIKEIKKLSLKKQKKVIQNYDFSQTLDFSKIPEVTTDLFRMHFHPSRKKLTVELIEKPLESSLISKSIKLILTQSASASYAFLINSARAICSLRMSCSPSIVNNLAYGLILCSFILIALFLHDYDIFVWIYFFAIRIRM